MHNKCRNALLTVLDCFLRSALLCSFWKNRPKKFFTGKIAFSFFKICVFNKVSGVTEIPLNFHIKCQHTFWPLQNVPWGWSHSIIPGKVGQNLLSPWKHLFFDMFVSVDLLGPKKWSYQLHNFCQKNLCALISCCLTFVKFDKTRQNRPKNFFSGKIAFSFKSLFFQQRLRSQKMILSFAQYLSKHLLCPHKMFPEVCQNRQYEKKMGQKLFFTGKVAFFFEMFVSNYILGPIEITL